MPSVTIRQLMLLRNLAKQRMNMFGQVPMRRLPDNYTKTNTLKSLEDRGFIEVHIKITPKGREQIRKHTQ